MSAYREHSVRGEPRADWAERTAVEGRGRDRGRRDAPAGSFGFIRILLYVFLILLAVTALSSFAVFSGVIPIGGKERTGGQLATQIVAQPQSAASQKPATQSKGSTVTREDTFGDWVYTCQQATESKEIRCSLAQQLANAKTKQAVFLWRLTQDGKGGVVSIWRTPSGVLLSRGIILDAGTDKPIAIPYQACGNGICQAVAGLAPDFIETLSKSAKATATVFTLDGKGINLVLSVNGLAKGLAELRKPATQ